MTDEISRLVEGLKLWRQSLKHDRESIIDEQLMRVNTLNQDMLSTVIAYIEAGEKEMPQCKKCEREHTPLQMSYSCSDCEDSSIYNAALDACAPIIARLKRENEELRAFEKVCKIGGSEREFLKNVEQGYKDLIARLTSERDALQAKLDAVINKTSIDAMSKYTIDLVEECFPKGKCIERGNAIVLHAQMLIAIRTAIVGEEEK